MESLGEDMRKAVLALAIPLIIPVALLGSRLDMRPSSDGVLLVTNKSENTVSFIDGATGEEIEKLPTGPSPHEVAVTPDGETAFVANYGGNSLTVVDVAGRRVAGTVDLGEHGRPHGIVVSADGTSVWVTTEGSQHLVEVDVAERSVKQAIRTGQRVTHMVVLVEGKGKAYTANIGSGNVTAIDTRRGTVIKQIPTGAGAEGIAVTPDERYVLVTNREAGTFVVIDPDTDEVIHTMEVGGFPIRVEVTPDGRRALVSQAQAGAVLEIRVDGWEPGRILTVGRMPVGIEITPDGKVAYIANTRDDMLTVVDLDTFSEEGAVRAGDEPDGMAWAGT